jgi:hypothetical protein
LSNFHDLRHAVLNGSPDQLFELGDFLVNRFAQKNLTTDQMQAMSGADLAREILNWAKEP